MSHLPRPWRVILVLTLSLAVIVAVFGNRYGLAAVKTALLIPEIFWDLPVHPLGWIGDSVVLHEERTDAEAFTTSLYRPADNDRHAAMVVVLGAVVPGTRADSRVVRLAESAARAGVVTLVVESNKLDQNTVATADIENLVYNFQYLRSQRFVDPARVGFVSFSVGAALALIAAEDPRINEQVAFVLAYGTYYDLRDLTYSVTTRRIVYNGAEEPWQPLSKTVTVLRRSIIAALPDASERAQLSALLASSPPAAGTASARPPASLSPDAQAVYRLLANTDPEQVTPLLAALSTPLQMLLDRLSPSGYIDRLKARPFIIATRDDNLVPYAESRRLRDAVAQQGIPYHYTELSLFRHVNVALSNNVFHLLLDLVKLYAQLYWLALTVTRAA